MPTCGDNGGTTNAGTPCSRSVSGDELCYQHKEDGNVGGRPPYEPNPEDRGFVRAGAMGGIPQRDIAEALGISDETMRKYYRDELDHGMTKANVRLVETAFRRAMSEQGGDSLLIFLLKTRLGWKETQRLEHGGADGQPIQVTFASDTPEPDDA